MKSLVQVALWASLLSMVTLPLAGCSTWKGLGKDIGKMGGAMEGTDSVTVSGTGERQMTVTVPRSVTVQRGQTQAVEVKIARKNFTDGVRVTISQLPNGVNTDDSSKRVETDAATFVLETSRTADLVANQAVVITVEGPEGMRASKQFNITVKD